MKKFLLFCILFVVGLLPVYSGEHSLIDDSLSVTDEKLSVISDEYDVVDNGLNIVDDQASIIDKDKSLFDKNLNIVDENKTGVGVFEKVVKRTTDIVVKDAVQMVTIDVTEDPFVGYYGKFLRVVTAKDPQAKKKFVQYFSDWQHTDQHKDFFDYAGTRAEREKRVEFCYNAAIKKFGIGSAVIATTWIVAFVVPGGQVYQVAFLIASTSTKMAIEGGAIAGVVAAGVELVQGKTKEEIIFNAVNGAADGYVIGAITGLVKGSSDAYKAYKKIIGVKTIAKVPGTKAILDGNVYSEQGVRLTTRTIRNSTQITPISKLGYDKNVMNSMKYLEKQPSDVVKILKIYLDNGYSSMNKMLRGKIPYSKYLADDCQKLNKMLLGNKNQAQQFYRYAKDNFCGYDLFDVNGKLMINSGGSLVELKGRLVEKGFSSFSNFHKATRDFAEGSKRIPYRLIMNSPEGNPGVNPGTYAKYSSEYEFLKPAGTIMDVIKVQRNPEINGFDIFVNEVL